METTLLTNSLPENPDAGVVPVSGWQKTAGVLIVTASVIALIVSVISLLNSSLGLWIDTAAFLAAVADVLYIAAFAILVFRSAGRQMRMMTSLLLLSWILSMAVAIWTFAAFRHYSPLYSTTPTYPYLMKIVPIIVTLLQMYAVSVMARVDETAPKENYVMIQLWFTSSLISASVMVAVFADIYIPYLSNPLDGIFGIMAAVSWKRIARTRLFDGKGHIFETVSYSPLNKFLVGPFLGAAVFVLPVLIRISLM